MKKYLPFFFLFLILPCLAYAGLSGSSSGLTSRMPDISNPVAPVIMGTQGFIPAAGSIAIQATGNGNSYWQFILQNLACSANASTDFVATANDGDDTNHYIDMGINSSCGGQAPFTNAHAAYLYTTENEMNVGATGASGVLNLIAALGVKIGNFASATSTYVCQSGGFLSTCQNLVSSFTNDAGYLTSLGSRTFNYPARALNSCFQPSATKDVDFNYSIDVTAAITLGGGTGLATSYTNSGCTTGAQALVNGAVSSVALSGTSSILLHGILPAGKWIKITSTASGGGTASIDTVQAETLYP